MTRHLMIIAGEASGDMRAAGLARAIKQLHPSVRLTGIGGECMRRAGVDCFTDITELAVIGIAEVLKNFSRIKKVFYDTLKRIDSTRPDAVILVDYPGFNLRLAAEIKKKFRHYGAQPRQLDLRSKPVGENRDLDSPPPFPDAFVGNPGSPKIIYYVSPQVWAWRENRIAKIKKLVDRMIVLFPFEQELYAKHGMKADYAGHPLVDEVSATKNQAEVLKSLGLSPGKTTIGLMPGSRAKEVERHLPVMLAAAQKLFDQDPQRQFILLRAPSVPTELFSRAIARSPLPACHCKERAQRATKQSPALKIYAGPVYDGINAMDAIMVASGTATLECALLKKPMVVIYKTSWITYAIAKSVIKIPYIGLVNIVAGKKIIEELIQTNATPEKIAAAIESALHDPQLAKELVAVKSSLGEPGASQRAAQAVLSAINNRST